jgi:hypothetical protein
MDYKEYYQKTMWDKLTEDTGTFVVGLIMFAGIFLGAACIFNICFDITSESASAEYHAEVVATVINIEKKEYEKEGLSMFEEEEWRKIKKPKERERYYELHKKPVKHTSYIISWQYVLNGDTITKTETDNDITFKKIGETKELSLYSNDGEKYYEDSFSLSFFSIVIGITALIVGLYMVFLFFGMIFVKIKKAVK